MYGSERSLALSTLDQAVVRHLRPPTLSPGTHSLLTTEMLLARLAASKVPSGHMLGALLNDLRRTLWKAFHHNALVIAKAAAYSQLLSLFPALLVGTSLLAKAPTSDSVRGDVRSMLVDLLPSDTMKLAQHYFETNPGRSHRLLVSAGIVAVCGSCRCHAIADGRFPPRLWTPAGRFLDSGKSAVWRSR